MATLITLTRLLLVFVLVVMVYRAPAAWQTLDPPLLLIIALDGLDGYIARKRGEVSVFGSIFDIAVARVVENVLWIVLGHLGLVPIWVSLVFIVRATIVDPIRYVSISAGTQVFDMMRSPLGRFLVASRLMRGFYGALKATTFAWLLALPPWAALAPATFAAWAAERATLTALLVYASVFVCLLRSIPVVLEFVAAQAPFRRLLGADGKP